MTQDLPTLILSDAPPRIPNPFGPIEDFMLELATGDDGLRPYHLTTLGGGDPIKDRQALTSGMNYLRVAADLEIAEAKTIIRDNHSVIVYGAKEAAREFWTASIDEGKDPRQIYDGWVALRELMASVRGKDTDTEE